MSPTTERAVTYRIDQDLPILEIGARSGLVWSREGFELAGIDTAARIRIDRPGGFATAGGRLAELAGAADVDCAGSGPLAFAAMHFDPDAPGELIVPRLVLGRNAAGMRWLTVVGQEPAAADRDRVIADAFARIDDLMSDQPYDPEGRGDTVRPPQPVEYSLRSTLTPERWRDDVVGAATDRINDGELLKAVFAREMVLQTDHPIRPRDVVSRLAAVFPSAAIFLVDGFVGASPELLVSRIDDVVRAHPLAGTAARSSDPVVDQRQTAALLASEKDRWEHRITIDWLLDTLLPFCSYVDAEPEPTIVTLANVHHLGTRVEGRLSSPSAPILELVAALHPTPAVGGSPQKEALALIAELEQAERGRYAGPVGWVDGGGNGEFAVGLRSAQMGADTEDTTVRFFAGVGVVGDSDPVAELEETRAKFRAMLGALIVP
ncbi:MAG: isochorismate synthase [Actinomycetota bacterium]